MQSANRAYRELMPALITDQAGAGCKTCTSMVSTVKDYKAKSQVYKGDFVTPTNVIIATFSNGSAKTFVSTKTQASTVVGADGIVVETVPADSGNYSFFLTWTSSQWKIAEIQSVA